ncbi:hypothetical protein Rhal01_03216 [Rubritalea halochordaticola]|uniref:DUF1851 domain-containing protein n=1 Tax=Rubritalea halochordaticola TaxID=714537 RepID=A0ABP9V2Z3_9BACT
MNARNLTKEGVKSLLEIQHDDRGDHMLWVANNGDIHIDLIPEELSPLDYHEKIEQSLKFRLEVFPCGNQIVGPLAAKDDEWIGKLYKILINNWNADKRGILSVRYK